MIEPVFGQRVEGCPYVIRPSAYVLLQDAGVRIAVVRSPAACLFPGGGIERGETPEQTIEREAAEECGLLVRPGAAIGSAVQIIHSADENICFEKRSVFFTGTVVGRTEQTERDHELFWLERDAARAMLTYESHRWVLDHFSPLP